MRAASSIKFFNTLFFPTTLLVLFFTSTVFAGELRLSNGDVIQGEVVEVTEDSLLWKSDILGELTIAKSNVASFSSSTILSHMKTGSQEAHQCAIQMQNPETVSSQCVAGNLSETSLASLLSVKPAPTPDPYAGESKLGYSNKSGNTNTEKLDFATNIKWQTEILRHEANLTIQSDKTNGQVVDERYKTNYQANYDYNQNWFSFGLAEYEKNRFSAIDEQYQVGAGMGHRNTFKNNLQTNAQLGLSYLISRPPTGDSEKDIAARWGLKLDWPVPNSELVLFHYHELLWPIDDIKNNQLESSTGLKVPVIGNLFGEFRYDFDYVNQPPTGQKHADDEWVISLGYQW